MKILTLILSLYTFHALAENRTTQVNLAYTSGSDEYKSQNLDGTVGLSEKWQLVGSYFRSDSGVTKLLDEKLISNEARLGADWALDPSLNAFFEGIARQDPFELNGRGASLGISSTLSDFWSGKKRTRLSFSLEQIRFQQNVTFTGPRASFTINRAVTQKRGKISLNQELLDWLEMGASFSRYNYDGETNQLAFVTSRRRTMLGGNGPNYGLTDRVASLNLTIFPLDWSETTFIFSRTKLLSEDEAETKSFTISQLFIWKKWNLGFEYTSSTYTSNASGTDPSTQAFVGMSTGYIW